MDQQLSDPEVIIIFCEAFVFLYDVDHVIGSGRSHNFDFCKSIESLGFILKM